MAKSMRIEKSVIIRKPRREVFDFLRMIRNQDHFSVWNMADPAKKVETIGADGSVGFTYKWDSTDKNVGAGSQQITKILDNERIDCRLSFERPMKNVADTSFIVKEHGPTDTLVTWTFEGPMKFPMSLLSFIFRRMLGKDIQKGLDNLKARLERKS